jgi:hypothetical protein
MMNANAWAFLLAASVLLSWQDNSNNEDGFRLERSTTSASAGFVEINGAIPANATTFSDALVAPSTAYWYRVRAFNTAGNSAFSNVAPVTTPPAVVIPVAPGGAGATIAGTLTNVSNRGLVTANDTTTIPGFTVSGGPVKVLVRAIGPGLAAFGVPGVCADPVISLRNQTAPTVEIAGNDNWSGQALVDAAVAAGAFPLVAGSKDAALLLTLAPGSYTAVITGVGGATGVALAEVFVVP